KRQVERCCQPAATVGDKEIHERSARIIEAHDIGIVLSGDVEVVIGAKSDSERDVEVAAGVGEEVDECSRRGVVASDAKIPSECAARDVEVAVGTKRHGGWRVQTTGADRVTSGHQQA